MNIKAQALLNAAAWVQERHGDAALARVLERCPSEVRERYISAIAIEWHPMTEFVAFLEVAEEVLASPRGDLARAVGAAGARQNTQGLVKRALFYIGTPRFLLQRIASMWSQFNSEGAMTLLHLDTQHAAVEVTSVPQPHELFCATITGWTEVVAEAVGLARPTSQHERCRARGDPRCLWRITWHSPKSEYRAALEEFERKR